VLAPLAVSPLAVSPLDAVNKMFMFSKEIRRPLRLMDRMLGYIGGHCAWSMNFLLLSILDAFRPALGKDIKARVESQLSQPYFITFEHSGRVNTFFFEPLELEPELRISDPAFADRLYKVEMFVDGRKQHAHVTFYKGRIFSIELKRPFKFYDGKNIRFGAVTLGKPKESMTGAIDRFEHGTGEI
jgi:hypothetical protein